ncbi:MAG: NAD(P)-binding domain-containing protein [Candidatus Moraniibacteriota bacterium]
MMSISILGTGVVGRVHAARLSELGHTVVLGTQDVEKTRAVKEKDAMGNLPFGEWQADHESVGLATFADAVSQSEIVFDALKGEIALSVLLLLAKELSGKILVDIANPLDFSRGMPPSLSVCNTDSLGEQIQRALPETRVVKAFHTTNASLQVEPMKLASGDHHLFVSGNDVEAKRIVSDIARSYGWKHIIDMGDITTARGTEMLLPVWLRLWSTLKTPMFNFKIVQ